jgi:hypothetical protein
MGKCSFYDIQDMLKIIAVCPTIRGAVYMNIVGIHGFSISALSLYYIHERGNYYKTKGCKKELLQNESKAATALF